LLLLLLGTAEVVVALAGPLDRRLRSQRRFGRQLSAALLSETEGRFSHWTADGIEVESLPRRLSIDMALSIAFTQEPEVAIAMYQRHLNRYSGEDSAVIDFAIAAEVALASHRPNGWGSAVQRVAMLYRRSKGDGERTRHLVRRLVRPGRYVLPSSLARVVSDRADEYPTVMVEIAQERLVNLDRSKVERVGKVAEDQGW
jgi:hypothetical protein